MASRTKWLYSEPLIMNAVIFFCSWLTEHWTNRCDLIIHLILLQHQLIKLQSETVTDCLNDSPITVLIIYSRYNLCLLGCRGKLSIHIVKYRQVQWKTIKWWTAVTEWAAVTLLLGNYCFLTYSSLWIVTAIFLLFPLAQLTTFQFAVLTK